MKKSRNKSHQIGQRAEDIVKITVNHGKDALFRSLGSTDYGIDAIVELFDNDAITGHFVLLQIKGSEKEYVPKKRRPEVVSCKVNGNVLNYATQHNIPVVLVVVDVPNRQFYYDLVNSDRFEIKGKTLYLPSKNTCRQDKPDFDVWLHETVKLFYTNKSSDEE